MLQWSFGVFMWELMTLLCVAVVVWGAHVGVDDPVVYCSGRLGCSCGS